MKIQKSTGVLLALAIALGAGVGLYEQVIKPQRVEKAAIANRVITLDEADLRRVEITVRGRKPVILERAEVETAWQVSQPQPGAASEAIVSFLSDQLIDLQSQHTFTAQKDELTDYGLAEPFGQIQLQLANKQTYTIAIGNTTLDKQSVYALVNGKASLDSVEVQILPVQLQYAVDRELSEWQETESP
ncbi:MAG: DUF4340 domain-containing protein [Cyanobacteria bacterium P01_H01_bin.15]